MIADDLTGACDAGVQFAQRGLSTIVWLDPQPRAPAEVTVLTTNSRNEPPAEACRKVRQACRVLGSIVFKKIDSTLYGNIVPEIEAALAACGFREAYLAPAFPAQGRTVEGGWLGVAGSDRRVHLAALVAGHPAIRCFDATTQDDLARVARMAFSTDPRPLLVGSAGLAMEVAKLLEGGPGIAASVRQPTSGDVLFLVGSANPVTTAQVRYLKAQRREAVVVNVARGGAEEAIKAVQGRPAGALVLTGGDTALEVCRALGVAGIRLEREILSGIPRGTLIGGPCEGVPVVTKAGGFGAEDALAAILEAL